MKQVTQRLRDGSIDVIDVPVPEIGPGEVLVDVRASVISAGTERTKVVTGRKSLVGKARSRPDQVKQVVEKARRDGVRATMDAVKMRLDAPSPLGYSAAGVVLEVGRLVRGISVGDRVACAGADYAYHAEAVRVPSNLCVPIPDGVSFDHAAFTTIGAIALHGVRQTDARLGERVAVIGMGLVGQLAGQLLRASGCEVVGIDLAQGMLDLALSSGAADSVYLRSSLAHPLPADVRDCDAVLITAAAPTSDPVHLAAELSRDRARVVILGDTRLDVPRAEFYEKELELRLSRSYGPGRYDRDYEERGLDYPVGYVRWTERRNLGAFLAAMAAERVDVEPLISVRIPLDDAPTAYDRLASGPQTPLGIVLSYEPFTPAPPERPAQPVRARGLRVGLIGAGSFAQRVLVPALLAADFEPTAVASATGLSAHSAEGRFGFSRATPVDELLAADDVDIVVVATQHSSHAELTMRALSAGKHVFVEKPPALNEDDLDQIKQLASSTGLQVGVGFNRRHAPQARALRKHVRESQAPIDVLCRVNAGALPADHWLNDVHDGGGRLLGEGCHFIDLACWIVGELPRRVSASIARPVDLAEPIATGESFAVTLDFADGSVATVLYSSRGESKLAKEYIEAHAGGRSAVLRDFRELELYPSTRKAGGSGKGHQEQMAAFRRQLTDGGQVEYPSPLDTMGVTFAALRAACSAPEADLR